MSFMKRTFDRMSKMFDTMEQEMDDVFDTMNKDMENATKGADLGPLPDNVVETVTEETETKPDGTVIHRKVTRRSAIKPTVKEGERTDPHKFVASRTGRFKGPPSETCEHCGHDPRNTIHEV